jgi:hypothetical protein
MSHWGPNNKYCMLFNSKKIRILDVLENKYTATYPLKARGSPRWLDKSTIVYADFDILQLRSLHPGKDRALKMTNAVFLVTVSSKKRFVHALLKDKTGVLWDLKSGKVQRLAVEARVFSMSPTEEHGVSGSDAGRPVIHNLADLTITHPLDIGVNRGFLPTWSGDGQVLMLKSSALFANRLAPPKSTGLAAKSRIQIWSIPEKRKRLDLSATEFYTNPTLGSIAYTSADRLIVIPMKEFLAIFDARQDSLLNEIKQHLKPLIRPEKGDWQR